MFKYFRSSFHRRGISSQRLIFRRCRIGLSRLRSFAEWFIDGLFQKSTSSRRRRRRSLFASSRGETPRDALDALAQPWNFRLAYAFPPLLRVIQKILVFSGIFLLVTPFWPAQKWFPAVLGLQVMDVHRLPATPEVINFTLGLPPHASFSTRLEDYRRLRGLAVLDASFRLISGSWRPSTAA